MDQEYKAAFLNHLLSFHPKPGDTLRRHMYKGRFMRRYSISAPEMVDLMEGLAADGYFIEKGPELLFSDKWVNKKTLVKRYDSRLRRM